MLWLIFLVLCPVALGENITIGDNLLHQAFTRHTENGVSICRRWNRTRMILQLLILEFVPHIAKYNFFYNIRGLSINHVNQPHEKGLNFLSDKLRTCLIAYLAWASLATHRSTRCSTSGNTAWAKHLTGANQISPKNMRGFDKRHERFWSTAHKRANTCKPYRMLDNTLFEVFLL